MILNNVKVKWARVGDNPATKYASDETEWTVDCIVTPEQSRDWVARGLAQKERFDPETGAPFVKIKRNTHFVKKNPVTGVMEKSSLTPPDVTNKYGEDMAETNIGNGSVCNVKYTERKWEFEKKTGVSPTLVGVQVMELEEYEKPDDGEGFTYIERPIVQMADTDSSDENIPF